MRRYRSHEEKAALVAEYMVLPHGGKGAWLKERGLRARTMQQWRRAYLFGDLERDLVPRDTSGMSVSDGVRLRQLEIELAAVKSARAEDRERHQLEVDRLNKVNDALGKAIGLLHDRGGVPEPTDGP